MVFAGQDAIFRCQNSRDRHTLEFLPLPPAVATVLIFHVKLAYLERGRWR